MTYQPIAPPAAFNKPRNSNLKEAEAVFEWFLSEKENRRKIFKGAIKTTSSFEEWENDLSEESLAQLSLWFAQVVTFRKRTSEELKEEKEKLLPPFENLSISENTLTSMSVSLCFDVGIYFGECLKEQSDTLKWELFQGKKYIDHHQIVLAGFKGGTIFNPRRVMEVQTAKIARGEKVDLLNLYKVWKTYIV